jgi:uncharacterized membrane protein YhaH (DUF805 family)
VSENLIEENKLVSFRGVIGRKRYAMNIAIVIFVAIIIFSMLFSDSLRMPKLFVSAAYLLSVGCMITVILSNHVRRFRDIRGTAKSDLVWGGILLVCLGIPVVNVLTLLFLVVKEGAITGGAEPVFSKDITGDALGKVSSAIDSAAASIHDRGKKVSSANEIEKLHELKEKGILSDEEFSRKKEEILKGAI